jgi:hypothetical protein
MLNEDGEEEAEKTHSKGQHPAWITLVDRIGGK